jgi:predicted ester cyclase
VAIHRVQDGQVAEHWSARDDLGLMAQLGVVQLPGPPG